MSGTDRLRVGIVGGTQLPGNVRTFLENLHRVLGPYRDRFDLELVIGDHVDPPSGYDAVDPGFDQGSRAIQTLRTLRSGLVRYASTSEVDVLFQVTKFPLHGCAAVLAGRKTDTPVLTRFAGDNFNEYRLSSGGERIRTFALNNLLGRVPIFGSDRIVALGPHGRSELETRRARAPIVRIPQPIDQQQFSPVPPEREAELARSLGFPPDDRVFLTVGRLTHRKGLDVVAETARELERAGEGFRWVVIGRGPLRETLERTGGVEVVGRVDFDEMPAYYRAADLLVHPSRIEGLPNVLLEAAACGTPSVARDVGDCSTVASETFAGQSELVDLLTADLKPVTLGSRFDPEELGTRYAEAIRETAGGEP